MTYRLGIDVGGTFTDLALISTDGALHTLKRPTRVQDIAGGCLDAITELLNQADVRCSDIEHWSHGTTVVLNAVLERKGARTALLVTEGFRDILEIRRQVRPNRYDFHVPKPEPLVPRSRSFAVRERCLFDGTIDTPLDTDHLDGQLDVMASSDIEAIAICLLHSYVNPAHEQAVLKRVRERLPSVYVTASHTIAAEFREYPRTATTVTNAYAGPALGRYLRRFGEGGAELGIKPPLTVFQSNGGVCSVSSASESSVKILYSGPAAGVTGAAHIAGQAGYANVITFDMGGTSCDVCLIHDGEPVLAAQKEVAGFPIRSTQIDVHSIGAGGGSIAWVNKGGLLDVGPHSAGADPGPAAYGKGGTAPTVTDANVVLGRLNPVALLDGELKVDAKGARSAIQRLARELNLPLESAALGILDIVNTNMIGAIRVVSVERGYDFRDCALFAYGGAGPLHAIDIAREMGFGTVIVPPAPGILCANGLLFADYRNDFTRTNIMPLDRDAWRDMSGLFDDLDAQARAWAAEQGLPDSRLRVEHFLHIRYKGQSYELMIPISTLAGPADVDVVATGFHSMHAARYGYSEPQAPVEVVNFHTAAKSPVRKPSLGRLRSGTLTAARDALVDSRRVWFDAGSGPVQTAVYRRELLSAGCSIAGPAVLEQMDCTTVMPPGSRAKVDPFGNMIITFL